MAQMARLRIKAAGISIFRKVSAEEYEMTFVHSREAIEELNLTETEKKLAHDLFAKQSAAQSGRCLALGIVQFDASAGYTTGCVPAPCNCGCYVDGMQIDAKEVLFGRFGANLEKQETGPSFVVWSLNTGTAIGSSCGCG